MTFPAIFFVKKGNSSDFLFASLKEKTVPKLLKKGFALQELTAWRKMAELLPLEMYFFTLSENYFAVFLNTSRILSKKK